MAGRDHTEPEFIVSIQAEDDRSNVNLNLDIGTVPGGSDVMSKRQLGGFSTAMNDVRLKTIKLLFQHYYLNCVFLRCFFIDL